MASKWPNLFWLFLCFCKRLFVSLGGGYSGSRRGKKFLLRWRRHRWLGKCAASKNCAPRRPAGGFFLRVRGERFVAWNKRANDVRLVLVSVLLVAASLAFFSASKGF